MSYEDGVDQQELLNEVILVFLVGVGFVVGGLLGGTFALGAGLAFAETSVKLARLEESVRDLSAENERLRQRFSELERE